jgi:hypothetical protein
MLTREESELVVNVRHRASDVIYLLDIWRPLLGGKITDSKIRRRLFDLKNKFEKLKLKEVI